MMKQDKWTQQLYDKLAEHETAAPEGLWADIEAALQQEPQPRTSRFVALRRWAVAASLAALVLGGGYLLWNGHDERMAEALQESIAANAEPVSPILQTTLTKETKTIANTVTPVRRVASSSAADSATGPTLSSPAPQPLRPPLAPPRGRGVDSSAINYSGSKGNYAPPYTGGVGGGSAGGGSTGGRPAGYRPAGGEVSSITIGLYAMNAVGAHNDRNGFIMAQSMAQQFENTYANSMMAPRRSHDVFTLAGYEERQHHYQPMTIGLTLSYPLTTRLSLTTGVVYTKLRSDFVQMMRSQQIQQEQTLHYVGVPFVLSYRLWQYKGFKTYLSAGVQADWNVATHLETEGVSQQLPKDRIQWSLNGSVGLQYDIIPQLGLYAEPGLSWYPDNGSRLQNYFKDKPLTFSLQMGLRLNLGR